MAKIEADNEIYLACPEHEAIFVSLAKSSLQSLINYLRNEQAQFTSKQDAAVKALHADYLALKKEASHISQNLNSLKAKQNWVNVIGKAIKKIEDLESLTEISRDLLAEKHFLQDFEKDMYESIIEEEKSCKNLKTAKSKKDKNQQSYNKISTSLSSQINKRIPQKVRLASVLAILEKKLNTVMQLEKSKKDEKNFLSNLQNSYKELIEIELDLQQFKVTLEDIDNLKIMRDKLIEKGKILLRNFLTHNKFDEAELLNLFYQHLSPTNIASLALLTKNSSLLNHLLKNRVINIHHNNFSILNSPYTSLIDYCFKQSNDKVPNMLSCLEVLIQHDGSLLEIDSSTQLPFAALLLLNPEHPLAQALKCYEDKHPYLYKQLNSLLQVRLNQVENEERKGKISALIQEIELKISTQQSKILLGNFVVELDNNYIQKIKESFVGNLIAQVLADPQVKVMSLLVENRFNQYLKKLPFLQRLHLKQQLKEFIGNYQKYLSSITVDQNIDFERCKKGVLEMLIKEMTLLGLCEDMHEIDTFISQHPYLKKTNKQIKERLQRREELDQKLNELKDYFFLNLNSNLTATIKQMLETPPDYEIRLVTNDNNDIEFISPIDINVEELKIILEDDLIQFGIDGDFLSLGIPGISAKDKIVLGKNKITLQLEDKVKALEKNQLAKKSPDNIGPGERLEILNIPSANGKVKQVTLKYKTKEQEKQVITSASALNNQTAALSLFQGTNQVETCCTDNQALTKEKPDF